MKYEMIKEDFEVIKADGKRIRGMVIRPKGKKQCTTVIFSHGFGSNYRELTPHGDLYAANGIACIFFDFCGGGRRTTSDGTMLEMTISTEVEDLNAVMDAVTELPFVNKKALYLQGESQGGFISAIAGAGRQKEISGLILWFPAFVIPDDARKRMAAGTTTIFGFETSPAYDQSAENIDVDKLQRAFEKPVLLIHGDRDACVSVIYSRAAAARYRDAALVEMKGAGHGFHGKDCEKAEAVSLAFIKRHSDLGGRAEA